MPVCAERLDDFLDRRSDAPLTDGERLTLTVSVLRGAAEAASLDAESPRGTWWLLEGGRPAFAMQDAGHPAAEEARRVLGAIAGGASAGLGSAITEVASALHDPQRLPRSLGRWEDALFAAAAPEPLSVNVLAPRRARSLASAGAPAAVATVRSEEPGVIARLARHVDADLADTFSRATTAVWRRFRQPRSARPGRPALLAGVTASIVLAGGLLWPVGGGGPATAGAHTPAPTTVAAESGDQQVAAEVPSAEGAPADAAASVDTASLEAVVDALLTRRRACAHDAGCLAAVVEDPARAIPAGTVDLAPMERRITLLDEFGGAAVLRVDTASGAQSSQLVVIVRRGEEWVLRDVHDAEHPG